jgi:phosphoglycerol transferase MdoB-like AlkP superfamily enzyme
MINVKTTAKRIGALVLFWVLLFDLGRVFFLIHNRDKFSGVPFWEWLGAFWHSLRLDLATAAMFSLLPLLLLLIHHISRSKVTGYMVKVVIFLEALLVILISAGEINAYPEWNHKLTTRVFTHLLNPDEVVRTADYSMTIGYIIYASLQLVVVWKLMGRFFPMREQDEKKILVLHRVFSAFVLLIIVVPGFLVLARGGTQPIPINIDAAYFSKEYAVNDLSVNSTYFFGKSWMLYKRSATGAEFPRLADDRSKQLLSDFFHYETAHENYIFSEEKPNFVFLVMESWTANAISSITGKKGATPYFDKLAGSGMLFTNVYATGGTSEVGNSSIFSGYPALPEVSVSMQPDKHRKIPSFNQDLKKMGYSSHYLFSGDLKYGNIGGYFVDHGFDTVEDENDFPAGLERGKLNYYDEDLYTLLLKKLDRTKGPFLFGAFTGSTHSPYDYPKGKTPSWNGAEADFMSSLFYADRCLYDFIRKCKKHKWYKHTVFVIVADHGHASAALQNPNLSGYFHVPLLLYGEPLKKEYRGRKIDKLGSQADIVRTLLYQLKGDYKRYIWSKDLLNPVSPEFALHTINRGFGWVTPQGNFSFNMDAKSFPDNTFDAQELKKERKRCHAYMSLVFSEYEKL